MRDWQSVPAREDAFTTLEDYDPNRDVTRSIHQSVIGKRPCSTRLSAPLDMPPKLARGPETPGLPEGRRLLSDDDLAGLRAVIERDPDRIVLTDFSNIPEGQTGLFITQSLTSAHGVELLGQVEWTTPNGDKVTVHGPRNDWKQVSLVKRACNMYEFPRFREKDKPSSGVPNLHQRMRFRPTDPEDEDNPEGDSLATHFIAGNSVFTFEPAVLSYKACGKNSRHAESDYLKAIDIRTAYTAQLTGQNILMYNDIAVPGNVGRLKKLARETHKAMAPRRPRPNDGEDAGDAEGDEQADTPSAPTEPLTRQQVYQLLEGSDLEGRDKITERSAESVMALRFGNRPKPLAFIQAAKAHELQAADPSRRPDMSRPEGPGNRAPDPRRPSGDVAVCRGEKRPMGALHYFPPLALLIIPRTLRRLLAQVARAHPHDLLSANYMVLALFLYFDLLATTDYGREPFASKIKAATAGAWTNAAANESRAWEVPVPSLEVCLVYMSHWLALSDYMDWVEYPHFFRFCHHAYLKDLRRGRLFQVKEGMLNEATVRQAMAGIGSRHRTIDADYRFPALPGTMLGHIASPTFNGSYSLPAPTPTIHAVLGVGYFPPYGLPTYRCAMGSGEGGAFQSTVLPALVVETCFFGGEVLDVPQELLDDPASLYDESTPGPKTIYGRFGRVAGPVWPAIFSPTEAIADLSATDEDADDDSALDDVILVNSSGQRFIAISRTIAPDVKAAMMSASYRNKPMLAHMGLFTPEGQDLLLTTDRNLGLTVVGAPDFSKWVVMTDAEKDKAKHDVWARSRRVPQTASLLVATRVSKETLRKIHDLLLPRLGTVHTGHKDLYDRVSRLLEGGESDDWDTRSVRQAIKRCINAVKFDVDRLDSMASSAADPANADGGHSLGQVAPLVPRIAARLAGLEAMNIIDGEEWPGRTQLAAHNVEWARQVTALLAMATNLVNGLDWATAFMRTAVEQVTSYARGHLWVRELVQVAHEVRQLQGAEPWALSDQDASDSGEDDGDADAGGN
ncbi:hypothetical protein JDV02_009923 [Purpureocillium takamizusanense]|uniref:Uncharacterized protein n=1 Tax=Purpureocillium takamizusanense TaxID=2060973 RepID=A0A9Q8QQY9_9HYPO|nr:uncharacterized protein JDV02_009923 [Purpureocillium takamizusanense]UNI24150.1 hypothetical protein JDV02_009923 [Purpureocillium takamizusanense]